MKEPWTVYIPCCCCCTKKREEQPPKLDIERGDSSTDNSLHEVSPAERAIDIALRHESSQDLDQDAPEARDANPPPSYDSVLKDDDRRTPRSRGPAELQGSTMPRAPPPVAVPDSKDRPPQGSVFSDDDDVVLTPPTTAPPTVIDEDSEDERINGTFRGR